ncbi:hypothetical protein [Janthinobacterium sp.]|uniref:hypothetical protein n=1 Tax=Janthinobacterium sp. TaxID=1871054 RepID=UPI00293D4EF7|nr:hypothetical protein [Janthinobacterium sp.]
MILPFLMRARHGALAALLLCLTLPSLAQTHDAAAASPSLSYAIDVSSSESFDMAISKSNKDIVGKAFGVTRSIEVGARALNMVTAGIEERLRAALIGTERAIADAELELHDSSDARCERALLLGYLGRHRGAMAEAERAAALQPQSAAMAYCRAMVDLRAGAFSAAERNYTRAIALGVEPGGAYFGRGISTFYQGHTAAARSDFEHLGKKAGNPAWRLRAAVWHTLATPDSAPPAPSGADAEADAESRWLAAVLQMFAGQVTPEHMLGVASRNAGLSLEARLVEAYFYAGRYYLRKKESYRAVACWRQALGKKVINSTYDTLALMELALLGYTPD